MGFEGSNPSVSAKYLKIMHIKQHVECFIIIETYKLTYKLSAG